MLKNRALANKGLNFIVYLKTWSRYYESNVDLKFRKLLFYPLNYSEKYLAGPAGIEPTSLSSKHSILSVELKALNCFSGKPTVIKIFNIL